MNGRHDPLVGALRPDRLHYATGELLGADDLVAEQTYHRRQLARVLQYVYGAGALAGLRVAAHHVPGENGGPNEVELIVEPGLAIDRAGRLIEVPRDACLRLRRWFEYGAGTRPERDEQLNSNILRQAWHADDSDIGGAVVADVFLAFHACDRGYTPAFASGPFDALDASQPSRVRDAYELMLIPRTEEDPPRAVNPWSGITGDNRAERLAAAYQESLDAWETLALPSDDHIGNWHENPPEIDPTAVLLARLRIAAAAAPNAASAPEPNWTADTWPDPGENVDNDVRNYLLTPAAIMRVIAG